MAFAYVGREVSWQCLLLKGITKKYINIVWALYSIQFLLNFIINMLLEITLFDEDAHKEQSFGHLKQQVKHFWDAALPSKYKMLLQSWLGSLREIIIGREAVERIDHLTYLRILISTFI